MVLVKVALSILLLAAIATAEECSASKDDCNDGDARMAQITCTVAECTCEGSEEDSVVNTVPCTELSDALTDLVYDTMTASGCKDLCSNLESTVCKYYKWEGVRTERTCSLMSDAQCTATDTGFCGDGHCESDGVDCGSGPIPPTLPPGAATCKMTLPKHNEDKLLWTCTDLSQEPPHIDVYETPDQEMDISPSTRCKTVHPCDVYPEPDRGLEYECNVAGAELGEWTQLTSAPDVDATILNEDRTSIITEAECPLGPLGGIVKTKVDDRGVDLICSGGDLEDEVADPTNNYQLPSPNTCLLLCDLNPILTVYSSWTDEGKKWQMVFEGESAAPVTAQGSEIYCWP